jgi:hypothetical protein
MVVVPYTDLHPLTALAVGPEAVLSRMSAPTSYWRLMMTLWASREDFTLVEHDVVPAVGGLEALGACPEDWCAYPYDCGGHLMTALGCTKFSSAIAARHPDLISHIAPEHRHWDGLDAVVVGELHRRGEHEHVHQPPATHHHQRSAQQARSLMHLNYIGNGSQYIHEDFAAGIPPIPPTDWDTDDPIAIAVCLESGLYEEGPVRGEQKAEAKAEEKEEKAEAKTEAKNVKDEAVVEKAQAKAADAAETKAAEAVEHPA